MYHQHASIKQSALVFQTHLAHGNYKTNVVCKYKYICVFSSIYARYKEGPHLLIVSIYLVLVSSAPLVRPSPSYPWPHVRSYAFRSSALNSKPKPPLPHTALLCPSRALLPVASAVCACARSCTIPLQHAHDTDTHKYTKTPTDHLRHQPVADRKYKKRSLRTPNTKPIQLNTRCGSNAVAASAAVAHALNPNNAQKIKLKVIRSPALYCPLSLVCVCAVLCV